MNWFYLFLIGYALYKTFWENAKEPNNYTTPLDSSRKAITYTPSDKTLEYQRFAQEDKQKVELEAKRREEELERLRREAKTLSGLKRIKPENFEFVVGSLFLVRGYKVFITPRSGDRGIDLVATKQNKKTAFQCKRYNKKNIIPERMVREFYGSFVDEFDEGIFITSSAFTSAAQNWAERRKRLRLINGEELANLMIMHNPRIIRNFENWQGKNTNC